MTPEGGVKPLPPAFEVGGGQARGGGAWDCEAEGVRDVVSACVSRVCEGFKESDGGFGVECWVVTKEKALEVDAFKVLRRIRKEKIADEKL